MENGITFNRDTVINKTGDEFSFKGCKFGRDILIEGGVHFNVIGGFIGDRTIIRSGARVEGNSVVLGTESYLDRGAWIGGGSCFDEGAALNAGPWLHMGWNSQVNIARGVEIGEEVGLGIETKIFTHGAYLAVDMGFPSAWAPVKIGNRVWLPNAWVNPGVTIGDNVVVAAMSLINKDLPSGCFAAGIPAVVIEENKYPSPKELDKTLEQLKDVFICEMERTQIIICGDTYFHIANRAIEGPVTGKTEMVRNQLRRNGIRFKSTSIDGIYKPWDEAYA